MNNLSTLFNLSLNGSIVYELQLFNVSLFLFEKIVKNMKWSTLYFCLSDEVCLGFTSKIFFQFSSDCLSINLAWSIFFTFPKIECLFQLKFPCNELAMTNCEN